jgi:hypothetical protein
MAVHLNAHLKTRFVPYLFTVAILVVVTAALAHASASSDDAPGAPSVDNAGDDAVSVTREELQAVMSESVDPERLDRRPGFSEIVVAQHVGERPTTGVLNARKEEEPPPGGSGSPSMNYLDFSDELPAQPSEASPGQR